MKDPRAGTIQKYSISSTAMNPGGQFGPDLIVGGTALTPVWPFIPTPLDGGALNALAQKVLNEGE